MTSPLEKRNSKSIAGLEVTDGSVLPMVPMVVPMDGSYGSYGCWVADGCPGKHCCSPSYEWFLWMVPMVPMAVGLRMAAR